MEIRTAKIHQLFKDMMENRQEVIRSVIDDIDKAARLSAGMYRFAADVGECDDQELRRKLEVTFRRLSLLADANVRLGMIALIYVSGDNSVTDLAKARMKLDGTGGRETLQDLWKVKTGRR